LNSENDKILVLEVLAVDALKWHSFDELLAKTDIERSRMIELLDTLVLAGKIEDVANGEYRITSSGLVDVQPLP
jgi:DNA-binding IclR family transcriptional regulator